MAPSLRVERQMLRDGATAVACLDEVGRGALCGPVTIGAVVVTAQSKPAPVGVRDSKLLSPAARLDLVPKIQRWAAAWSVGHASPAEIDEYGIVAALRLAGQRALDGLGLVPDAALLDGNHDYLSPPAQATLFDDGPVLPEPVCAVPPVTTLIKADMTCAAVAAASVLAKTTRDALLLDLAEEFPDYGWRENKGYASAEHVDALRRLGPTVHHRRSWRLPGVEVAAPRDGDPTGVPTL
ncbi:ribonuclease HII [Cellulomonas sp. NPDC089187]|uniref:ribonuclease HII n=1 Tax=Cellulomonas sp. NPDC089187 TaxID=3154970 RepID=UPI00342DADEF